MLAPEPDLGAAGCRNKHQKRLARPPCTSLAQGGKPLLYRLLWPFVTLRVFFLFDPRGVVRLAFGAAFLRAARFNVFRSALSSIFVVFVILFLGA